MRDTSPLAPAVGPWLIFLAVVLAPLAMSSGWINIAILRLLFIYLCVAWNIVGGIAGQFCIGHSLFLAAGAYTSTLLSTQFGITPWLGMFAGAALATVIGIFIAWLSFRYELPPLSFALVTIGREANAARRPRFRLFIVVPRGPAGGVPSGGIGSRWRRSRDPSRADTKRNLGGGAGSLGDMCHRAPSQ